jgi:hypothetical protein
MVNRSVSNPNKPGLRIRILGKKVIGCNDDIIRNLKGSCLNVDRDNLPMVACFNLVANLGCVEGIATLGKFFFAVTRLALSRVEVLSDCHNGAPGLNVDISTLSHG